MTSVTVSGYGKNSAEIVFVILNAQTGENQAFHILAYPAYERQVFAATAAVLSIAYTQRQPVRVSYLRLQNETDRALSVALDQAIPRNRRR